MTLAQQLYEGIDLGDEGPVGLITYMRTDSVRIAREAQEEAREWVIAGWGANTCPTRRPTTGREGARRKRTKRSGPARSPASRRSSRAISPRTSSRSTG